jgi:hypothetical protein
MEFDYSVYQYLRASPRVWPVRIKSLHLFMPRSYWPHSSSERGYMARLVLRLLSTMPCLSDLVVENHFFPAVHTASSFHDVLQRLRVPLPLACILGPRLRVSNLDISGTLLYSPHFPALPQLPSVVTLHVSLQALTAIDCRCLVESFPSVEDVTVSWFDYYERSVCFFYKRFLVVVSNSFASLSPCRSYLVYGRRFFTLL